MALRFNCTILAAVSKCENVIAVTVLCGRALNAGYFSSSGY